MLRLRLAVAVRRHGLTIVETNDERVIDVGEYVALHFGALAVAHLERGLLEHLHGVEGAGVGQRYLAHEEDLAERALAEHLEQLEVRRRRLLAALLGYVLDLDLGLVLALLLLLGARSSIIACVDVVVVVVEVVVVCQVGHF